MRTASAVLTLVAATAVLGPAGTAGQSTDPARASRTATDSTANYGKTPDELLPYRGFRDPYIEFFADEQPFLGTGRDKAPPAGLESVRIGLLAPLDDASAEAVMGRRMLQGATLAVEEANADGGYRGLPFEIVVRDDVGPWGSSSNKFVELYDEAVWAVLGSIDGQSTHIALRAALKLEVPIVTSGSTDPTLTETRIPWYVRVNADDRQNAYALASWIFQDREFRRVAVFRANTRYGRVGIGEFRDAARRLQKPLLLELRYGTGDRDFTPQIERMRDAGAEAVVLWGDSEDMARIVRQMRALGMTQPVYGPDRMLAPEFLAAVGDAGDGVVAVDLWNPEREDPVLRAFYARYRERFGEEADAMAAHGYDGMNLILDAVREAGLNRARIRDAMTAVDEYRGVTGSIPLDPTWNDVGAVYLAELRDGAYVYFAESVNGRLRTIGPAPRTERTAR
ncbi:MAG: ABC transporter substrate-binding protein [Gemmatimonadota bacterium]|jgi:branched-chain amino acid transport system substrate-binding protein